MSAFQGMAMPDRLVETSVGAMANILPWSGSVSSSPWAALYCSRYGEYGSLFSRSSPAAAMQYSFSTSL